MSQIDSVSTHQVDLNFVSKKAKIDVDRHRLCKINLKMTVHLPVKLASSFVQEVYDKLIGLLDYNAEEQI